MIRHDIEETFSASVDEKRWDPGLERRCGIDEVARRKDGCRAERCKLVDVFGPPGSSLLILSVFLVKQEFMSRG